MIIVYFSGGHSQDTIKNVFISDRMCTKSKVMIWTYLIYIYKVKGISFSWDYFKKVEQIVKLSGTSFEGSI